MNAIKAGEISIYTLAEEADEATNLEDSVSEKEKSAVIWLQSGLWTKKPEELEKVWKENVERSIYYFFRFFAIYLFTLWLKG